MALGGAALLVLAALVPGWRPGVALLVLGGWVALALGRRRAAVGWAAAIPLAAAFTWPFVLGGDQPLGALGCVEPFAVIAIRRLVVAVLVLGFVAGLARIHGSSTAELGLGRPGYAELAVAVGGLLALAVGGLVVGPVLAEPFFGRLEYERPLGALLPAIVFGAANGTLEEVAYRGALQGWLTRVSPPAIAIGAQALIFGIAHAGPEVTALLPIHVALMTLVGLLGGLVVRRTGSLAIPIGIHVGADIALYYGLACRAAG